MQVFYTFIVKCFKIKEILKIGPTGSFNYNRYCPNIYCFALYCCQNLSFNFCHFFVS